jgi:hypothetical protein
VPNGLRDHGLTVEAHKDHFNSDEDDAVWIREVGRRGWAIITKDKRVRSRQLEVVALLNSGQPTFVVTSGNATAQSNVKTIMTALNDMIGCIRTIQPPFVAQITGAGQLTVLMTQAKLMELAAKGRHSK